MIQVIVRLIPHGNVEESKVIGTMSICNNLTHPDRPECGNYDVAMNEVRYDNLVTDHNRRDGVWVLIREAIAKAEELHR